MGKLTVFTRVNQHCGAKNKEKQGKLGKLKRELHKIFKSTSFGASDFW